MKTKIVTGWDNWKTQSITLLVKEDGKTVRKVIQDVDWYFAISKEDFATLQSTFFEQFNNQVGQSVVYKLKGQGEYVLVYCVGVGRDFGTKQLLSKLAEKNVKTYEADLTRTKRYLIDNDCELSDELKVLYYDIETDDSGQGIEVGRDRIVSWAACDSEGNTYFECLDDEKELLIRFLKVLDDYDVFTGWNSEKFDLPYIEKRMEKHKLEYEWRTKLHLDMMKRCIKVFSYEMDKIGLTGFSLNEFARVFLQDKKVEHKESILELFQTNREKLKEYNIHDVEILRDLDKKLEIIKLMIHSCIITGAMLNRFYVGELLDMYILRKSKEYNLFFPTKTFYGELTGNEDVKIIGGYVKPPTVGLYDDVRIFDFKSLYPSIIVSWNISADSMNLELSNIGNAAFDLFVGESKIEEIEFSKWDTFLKEQKKLLDPTDKYYQTANNNFYHKDKEGFIAVLINELLDARAVMKKKMATLMPGSQEYSSYRSSQATIKELANSMYGITGDKNSRYFNKNLAESITLTGQFLTRLTIHLTKKRGYPSIYGDTDSIFVPIPNDSAIDNYSDELNNDLITYLNNKFGLTKNIVLLEYEKAYGRMIMLDKKRYTGTMKIIDGKYVDFVYSKGVEDVKKNTIKITKEKIKELILMITKENKSLKFVRTWLEELKDYVFSIENVDPEDIVISVNLSKPTTQYKTKLAHVKLAEQLIKRKILEQPTGEGWNTRIKYIIEETKPAQKAVYIDDFAGKWDKQHYWDTLIYAPIHRILKTVWPTEDWTKYSFAQSEILRKREERAKKKEQRELELEQKKKEREAKKAEKLKQQTLL